MKTETIAEATGLPVSTVENAAARIQEKLTGAQGPSSWADALRKEVWELRARRKKLFPDQRPLPAPAVPPAHDFIESHRLRPLGVGLSGGGIRSATFNLGIIQGLAKRGLLPYIDYLSTVSGGGYIGSWLHGVIRNKHNGDPRKAEVELDPRRVPGEPESDPITFLRKYSNYLAPVVGLFSPDTWTIGAVWFRNMALNLLILTPFLAGVVLAALLFGVIELARDKPSSSLPSQFLWAIPLLLATVIVGINLRRVVRRQFRRKRLRLWLRRNLFWRAGHRVAAGLTGKGVAAAAVAATMIAAYFLGATPHISPNLAATGTILWTLFLLLQYVGGFGICYKSRHEWAKLRFFFYAVIPPACAGLTVLLMQWVWHRMTLWTSVEGQWARLALGPPLIILTWIAGVVLQIGLMGADFPDAAREWLARYGAMLFIAIAAWMGIFVVSIFGPYWISSLTLAYSPAGVAALLGWVGSGLGGWTSGKSEKTVGGPLKAQPDKKTWTLELIGRVAPTVFLAGSLLTVSFGVHLAVRALVPEKTNAPNCAPKPQAAAGSGATAGEQRPDWLVWLEPVKANYWCVVSVDSTKNTVAPRLLLPSTEGYWLFDAALGLGLACAALVVLLPLRFNINEFSLHHFYKNRLVRCYLGASKADLRRPNRLTGFDPNDDFPLASLRATAQKPYLGPYPIVNAALNLNTGSELAKAERKASSFVFTPHFCGFDPPHSKLDKVETRVTRGLHGVGYRATLQFMDREKGPDLGTAFAISGAAANPNAGYHTSAPLAFLMTIFDVRLGWWVGNPRRDGPSGRPGPRNALISLLSELFAQTNGRSSYVNVSDGGHFDNLGLYELVRRRCRYIIIGDAEEDPNFSFGGLGGAIRRVRADFGVEISIDPEPLRRSPETRLSKVHCVVGTIRYPEKEAGHSAPMCDEAPSPGESTLGWLLYCKSSLTGDEPEDVRQYHASHPVFPHEPTADQFFTESQFESYRQLGLHVIGTAFENVNKGPDPQEERAMLEMFQDLCRKWYPEPSTAAGNFTERYSELMRRLSEDPELSALAKEIFPSLPEVPAPATPIAVRKSFFFCLEMIQLMEDLFFELNLAVRQNRENPKYAGWMSVLRTWSQSPSVKDTWSRGHEDYNVLFQEFFDGLSLKDE